MARPNQGPTTIATNANYSSGPRAGSPTKITHPSPANGFTPGQPTTPEPFNYLLNERATWENYFIEQLEIGSYAHLLEDFQWINRSLWHSRLETVGTRPGTAYVLPGQHHLELQTGAVTNDKARITSRRSFGGIISLPRLWTRIRFPATLTSRIDSVGLFTVNGLARLCWNRDPSVSSEMRIQVQETSFQTYLTGFSPSVDTWYWLKLLTDDIDPDNIQWSIAATATGSTLASGTIVTSGNVNADPTYLAAQVQTTTTASRRLHVDHFNLYAARP